LETPLLIPMVIQGFASKNTGSGIIVWSFIPFVIAFRTMEMIDDSWSPYDPIEYLATKKEM